LRLQDSEQVERAGIPMQHDVEDQDRDVDGREAQHAHRERGEPAGEQALHDAARVRDRRTGHSAPGVLEVVTPVDGSERGSAHRAAPCAAGVSPWRLARTENIAMTKMTLATSIAASGAAAARSAAAPSSGGSGTITVGATDALLPGPGTIASDDRSNRRWDPVGPPTSSPPCEQSPN